MTPILGRLLSWMKMKEDEDDPTEIQNITSSFVEGGGHSLDFHRRTIHDFPPKKLIKWAGGRECKCPLRGVCICKVELPS